MWSKQRIYFFSAYVEQVVEYFGNSQCDMDQFNYCHVAS